MTLDEIDRVIEVARRLTGKTPIILWGWRYSIVRLAHWTRKRQIGTKAQRARCARYIRKYRTQIKEYETLYRHEKGDN